VVKTSQGAVKLPLIPSSKRLGPTSVEGDLLNSSL